MLFEHEIAWENDRVYEEVYRNSIDFPNEFWMQYAQDIEWKRIPNLAYDNEKKEWLSGGISNVCYNCVDRHADKTPEKAAIIWYGDEYGERREISYAKLQKMVIQISSILKGRGIKKNDVVGI